MNYEVLTNPILRRLKPSGIRKFFDIANEMEDVITLSIGEPDFSTPWHIRQEGIRSLEKGKTWYTANAGLLRLRQAIGGYVQRHIGVEYEPRTEILVTVGGSEAIDLCLRSLICPGDEVLIPQPSFVCYEPLTVMAGGTAVPIVTKAEDGFRLTAEALRAALTFLIHWEIRNEEADNRLSESERRQWQAAKGETEREKPDGEREDQQK